MEWIASQILYEMSGRRFGPCPAEVRPCRKRCGDTPIWVGSGVMQPYIQGGKWFNDYGSCGCKTRDSCSCVDMCEVQLQAPVASITEVLIDGAVVDPADYRVDSPALLVAQNGRCWPACQDMTKPAGEPGTFVVRYELGLPVPVHGVMAVSILVAELIKACEGDDSCRLPSNWVRITRQGVTVERERNSTNDRTGIYEIDALFLDLVNPERLSQPARVYSPDLPRSRQQVWP
ncbi:hypothetical protein F7O44_16345 [Phytoactinopolyspora sp. XMNu-373]|uniref:Uncharacterized protein n=2 Tax=Phytoactinopolyspora mesophila TaxID=2650750 RepID=A0A7K3M5Z6_9ACTN|nr:hypothetical protein [Phytoactinopolyspora mesophila]